MVDMHCDETDDPLSRHIETLAYETQRLGLQRPRRRLAPHLDAFDGQLLRLQAAAADRRGRRRGDPQPADQHHAAGPARHLSQAPRHDPRAGDDQAPGIRVGFGQDCVLDPWYSLGTADMLDVAFMGLHVAQMTSPARHAPLLRHGDERERGDHGACKATALPVGNRASLVVLDAGNPVEAMRLRADRLLVVSNGKVVARRPKSATQLSLDGRPGSVDRRFAGHH